MSGLWPGRRLNDRQIMGNANYAANGRDWVVVAALIGRSAPGRSWPRTVPIDTRKAAPRNVAAFPFSRLNVAILGQCIWEQISGKRTLRATGSAIAWPTVPLQIPNRERQRVAAGSML